MLLCVCVMLLVASDLSFCLDEASLDDQWEQWEQWKITYGKEYTDYRVPNAFDTVDSVRVLKKDEEVLQRIAWEHDMHMIETHNQEADQGKHSYKLEMNHLGPSIPDEVAKKMAEYKTTLGNMILKEMEEKMTQYYTKLRNQEIFSYYKDQTTYNQEAAQEFSGQCMKDFNCTNSEKNTITCSLPKSIDYREKGLVTRVKDQGNCGSCWAFSVAGALEGQLAKKTGRLLDLSPQNLIDCAIENKGCVGGYPDLGFKYVQVNGGINSEEDYPYAEEEQQCGYKPSARAAQCKGFEIISVGDERALAEALYEVGPLTVSINTGNEKFDFYKSGIYYNPECDQDKLDHGMLLVGYGETAEGEKYWIVKNSFGESWGEKGYMRIARNRDNHCGIASDAIYPVM